MRVTSSYKLYSNEFVISDLSYNVPFIVSGMIVTKLSDTMLNITHGTAFINRSIVTIPSDINIDINEVYTTGNIPDGSYQLIFRFLSGVSYIDIKSISNSVPARNQFVLLGLIQIYNGKINILDINVPRSRLISLETSNKKQFIVGTNLSRDFTLDTVPTSIVSVSLNGLNLFSDEFFVSNDTVVLSNNVDIAENDKIEIKYI